MLDAHHVDFDALRELRDVMGAEFTVLVETFRTDSRMRLQTIAEALASADGEGVRRAAHSFKGSAGNMAAPRLTELCRQLEARGATGELAGADDLLHSIETEFAAVDRAFAEL